MPANQLNPDIIPSMKEYVTNHRAIHKDVPIEQWKSDMELCFNMVASDDGVFPNNPLHSLYMEEFRKIIDEIVTQALI